MCRPKDKVSLPTRGPQGPREAVGAERSAWRPSRPSRPSALSWGSPATTSCLHRSTRLQVRGGDGGHVSLPGPAGARGALCSVFTATLWGSGWGGGR